MYNDLWYKKAGAPFANDAKTVRVTPEEFSQRLDASLFNRAVDTDGFTDKEILAYAKIYANLAYADQDPTSPISIKNVASFFNTFLRNDNFRIWKKTKKLFGLSQGIIFEKKIRKVEEEVMDYFFKIHTIDNLLKYSISFQNFITEVASPRFENSEKYTVNEIAKWLNIWYVFFSVESFTPFDYFSDGKLKEPWLRSRGSSLLYFPETIMFNSNVLSKLKDNQISIKKMKHFIDSSCNSEAAKIYNVVQLDNSTEFSIMSVSELNDIKSHIPAFKVSDFYAGTVSVKEITEDTYKKVLYSLFVENNVISSAVFEDKLFETVEENLVRTIFDKTDLDILNLFEKYSVYTEITASEVMSFLNKIFTIDFKKGFVKFNPKQLKILVDRINKKDSLSHTLQDRTVLRIYNYLKTYDPVCGNSKQKFSTYGI